MERIGAFTNITKIGSKVFWKNQLNEMGIQVKNHKILTLEKNKGSSQIVRHKTAISRSSLSLPSKFSIHPALHPLEVFDYGCGGDDLNILNGDTRGNHFVPDEKNLKDSDVVNLGFVLNVIEDIKERSKVLSIFNAPMFVFQSCFTKILLSILFHLTMGISLIRTFQKFYDQKSKILY